MQFSWDEKKRRAILQRRGFDILHAAKIFNGPVLTEHDTRRDYGEDRYISLGKVGEGNFVVVHTPRGETEHLITAWRAGREARRRYKARFA